MHSPGWTGRWRLAMSYFRLAIPRQQPPAHSPKSEIGGKSDDPDGEDPGQHTLRAERLLCLKDHVPDADRGTDHFRGYDDDQADAPGEAHAREDVRQACGQHDPLKISNSVAPSERAARTRLLSIARAPA